ncbi:hypothetical protein GQ53DRAFT_749003, partial [Thozetella sp. PMI_491]
MDVASLICTTSSTPGQSQSSYNRYIQARHADRRADQVSFLFPPNLLGARRFTSLGFFYLGSLVSAFYYRLSFHCLLL